MVDDPISRLSSLLETLSEGQVALIAQIAEQLKMPYIEKEFDKTSDIMNENLFLVFGDLLRIHHSLSREPLSKDRFEYAFERAANLSGLNAKLAPKGNPGYDITIDDVLFSLKTEAAQNVNTKKIHISKFMELGKGHWRDTITDLEGLRDRFLQHMTSYDRILVLRKLRSVESVLTYELVEIPKTLLEEAKHGIFEVKNNSSQTPKPGYCRVWDSNVLKFQLYFDGGTERKLQIKQILRDYCQCHAKWSFFSALDL